MSDTKELTLEHIEQVVRETHAAGANLALEGYVSSDGSVATMILEFLGPNGYKDTLAASLDMIAKGQVDLSSNEGLEVGAQAAAALSASWSKSLNGLHKTREFKEDLNFEEIDKQGYTLNSKEQVVLKNMAVVWRQGEQEVERSPSKTPLVRAKKEILSRTPMYAFRGQLNLAPDKLRDIYAVTKSSIG